MEIRKLRFQPGARSIIQMGEELIGHSSTALGELIKNAYDADALECKIYIHPDENKAKSFIVICDNGTGMDKTTLFGEWLQPSISSKRKGNRKTKILNRTFLGSKGIGRLAAMALGQHLTVITKTIKEKEFNWIHVDREIFKADSLLNKVFFRGGIIKNFYTLLEQPWILNKNFKIKNEFLVRVLQKIIENYYNEGTLILIENLDDSIVTIINDDCKDGELHIEDSNLMRGLKSLVTPLGLIEDSQKDLKKIKIISENYYQRNTEDSFSLSLGVSRYDDSFRFIDKLHLELVKPAKLLRKYHYRVIGKVATDGKVTGHYYCQRIEEFKEDQEFALDSKYVFSDEMLRKRRQKNEEDEEVPEEIQNAEVGNFFFDLRVYDRDNDAIDSISEYMKLDGRLDTRRFLDRIVGLRIAKNGFGIKPYGEEEKDWMELGQMRVQDPSKIIGPNQILGYIFLLSPENDGLKEKTNREGFFENKAFIDLKKILRAILIELGRRRHSFRLKHNIGRIVKSKLARPDTEAFIKYISSITNDAKVIGKTQKFISDVTTSLDNMEFTLSFSQRLATLGSGLELVYHELSQPITQLGAIKTSLEMNCDKVFNNYLIDYKEKLKIFDSSLDVLEELKKSIMPAIGISRTKTFSPADTFQKVCRLFNKDIIENNIRIIIDDDLKDYQIKDYEYALWVAILNIINNAVYWLKFIDDSRVIHFSFDGKDKFIIANSGPEIDPNYLDQIFEYGITFKQEKNATGLGLAFTRSILNKHDWEIYAENLKNGPAFIIYKSKEN